MSIAFVSGISSSGNGTGVAIDAPVQAHTTGNLLVVGVRWEVEAGVTCTGVTDTAGNTYVAVGSALAAGTAKIQLFYAYNVTGNASNVVEAAFSATCTYRVIHVIEYSGIATASDPLDATASNTVANDTSITSGTFTTAQAEELLFAFAQSDTPGTGYTSEEVDVDSICISEDKIVASIQSGVTASASTAGSGPKMIQVATFKAPAAGGSTPIPQRRLAFMPYHNFMREGGR